MNTSEYFKVKDIVYRIPNSIDLSYLKGRNIFSVDLRKESDYILEYCPDFNKVRLAKVLPNRIFVDFIKRNPIALVRLYKYYFIDKDAVLFNSSVEQQASGLPVITGLESKISGIRTGRKCNVRELALAINIIKEMGENRILKNYKISKIDLANISNIVISIVLPSSLAPNLSPKQAAVECLELRIGQDEIKSRIIFLGQVIVEANNNLSNIKYIDLRFKEPVVKFKDAK